MKWTEWKALTPKQKRDAFEAYKKAIKRANA